jgi:hypothetical protein
MGDGEGPGTLHEVTEVAVIRHHTLGVLMLHSADRAWHFPDTTVRVGDPWDASLRDAVLSTTGIDDLTIGPVLMIQNFGPGEVDVLPQFGIFFLCATQEEGRVSTTHRWIDDAADLKGMHLFHPLIAELTDKALAEPAEPRP